MANLTLSSSLFCCIFLVFSFNIGGNMAQEVFTEPRTWCVAKPSVDIGMLEQNIDYACKQIGVDCSIIQEGGQCYYPNNDYNHASVVMNLYYQLAGPSSPSNCYFSNTGLIVVSDPSYGECLYFTV